MITAAVVLLLVNATPEEQSQPPEHAAHAEHAEHVDHAHADAPADAPPTLKLSDVLGEIEAQSPSLQSSRARADAMSRAADAAGFWDEPFLAVGPDEVSISDRMPVIRFQLSQVIPFPGKRSARAEAARDVASAAARDTDTSVRTLRVVATQLFARAVYLQKALETNALLQQAVKEVQASASARYMTGGAGMHHDALLADAELAVLERDKLVLSRGLDKALVTLDALRGKTPKARATRADAVVPALVDDVRLDVPPSFDDAVAEQPELRAAQARVAAADADARAKSLAALPDFSVQLMAMQSFMKEEPSNVGAMVGVSLPIFLPWKQDAQADAAKRNADAERESVEALVLALHTEWEQARQDLATAEDTAALYEQKILPSTKLALESSETAYATKETPLVEVLGVIRAYHQAALEAEAAKLDVRLAALRLDELLSGAPVLQLAPSSPTLFGGGGMGTASMSGGMSPSSGMGSMGTTPVRMGSGLSAPAPGLVGGDEQQSGMGGM